MPKYKVTAPDGNAYIVNAPEGATQDQVMAYAQQHYGQNAAKQPTQDVPTQTLPDTNVSPEPSAMQQLGRSVVGTGRSLAQGLTSLGGIITDPIAYGVNKAEDAIGVDPKYHMATMRQSTDAALNAVGVPQYQPQNGAERIRDRITEGAGGMLGGMGVGSALQGVSNATARTVGNALASNPGAQLAATVAGTGAGGIAHEAGASPKVELAASLLGGLTPAGLEASAQGTARLGAKLLGSTDAETSRLASLAQQEKIPLKASQISESRVGKLVDSATGQVPFSGGQKFQGMQQSAFNRAVAKSIGLDADKVTPEKFNGAVQRISGEFDRLTTNNSIPITPDLGSKLQAVASDAAAYYGPEAASMVNATIERLVSQSKGGVIPGRVYQSIDSKLGQAARAGGERSVVLGDLQEVLRDAMESNLKPADSAAWKVARQQWKDMKAIEPLVAKSPTGDISPAQLLGRVTANGAGKTSMARGTRGGLGDLARIGQKFLKEPVPDSGTARRTAVIDSLKGLGTVAGSALGTGAAMNPVAGIAGGLTAVGISRQIQNILKNPRLVQAVLNSPKTNPQLRAALQQQLGSALGNSANSTEQSVRLQGR